MNLEISQSILGAIARESGDIDASKRYLLSSIDAAREKKSFQVLCGSLFHLARLYFDCGETEKGSGYLKQAVELASGNRYFMFWDIHLPTMTDMMLRSIRYGYCSDYARELLNRLYSPRAVSYLCEKIKDLDESHITSFVDDFVFTYNTDDFEQNYFVKACLFGKSEIYLNGAKVPDSEWKTKKVKSFLEYLLLSRGNAISKELLAETLWPNSSYKSAISSQRTALYYLRKTLSKYNVETAGDNAFILETPGGLQIRDNNSLDLDINEFLALYNELSLHSDTGKQVGILKRMLALYKGDLMEESDYADLVTIERERLKSIYIMACEKLSSIYINQGETQLAEEVLKQAYAAEPYNENICLELLKLYISQGRKNKAIRLYYIFKKRFEQELDIKVDKRLTETVKNS